MAEKTKQLYFDFDEYIRQGEPEAAKSAEQWNTAIGLQAVDGIKPSNYLLETAKRNIEGEITIDEVQELLRSYYASAANRDKIDEDDEEADKEDTNNVGSVSVVQLTERQKSIYKLIKDNPQVSVAEMSVVLSVVKRTVERDISKLRGMRIITREGNTSAGKWVILKEV